MTTIKFRRDTSANWTSVNPIPAQGEPCYETDTGKLKIGNGSDNYVTLPYVSDGGGSSGDLPIATATTLGGVKVGDNLSITEDGTLSATGGSAGTTDYTQLENKPQINSVELTGNKTLNDLGIQPKGNYQPAGDYATTTDIPTKTSELTNDSGFLTEAPTNMVTTDTTQTISGDKTFTRGITTTDIYPSGEITFTRNSQYRYINYMDTISGGYHAQNGYITFNGDTTLVGDNKLVLNGRTGGLKLTAASSASITCENDLIAPNIRTTANGTIKLTHPMDTAEGLITFSNDYGQLSISSSGGSNNNLFGVVRGSAHALINGDNIETKDKDGNVHTYINSKNIDITYMKWDDTNKKLTVDTAAVAHLAMPSNTKVNLTLGASYATYTAPADGWFTMAADGISRLVCAGNSSNTTSTLYGYSTDTNNPAQDNYLRSTIPVSKDQSIFIEYSGTPVNKALAFVYTEGTKPTNV